MKDIFDFVLYTNIVVAICAAASALQTRYLLTQTVGLGTLEYFFICGTLCQYASHRVIGRVTFRGDRSQHRFLVIERYFWVLVVLAGVTLTGAIYFFLQLSQTVQLAMLIPILVAGAYVFPVLGKRLRLRDVNYLKIFLISIVWSWVTVFVVMLHYSTFDPKIFSVIAERAFFIFVVALPFDIRDITFDKVRVMTIPHAIGIGKTKRLGYILLISFLLMVVLSSLTGLYTWEVLWAMIISALLTGYLLRLSSDKKHDYFFSGALDSMVILQFVLVFLLA